MLSKIVKWLIVKSVRVVDLFIQLSLGSVIFAITTRKAKRSAVNVSEKAGRRNRLASYVRHVMGVERSRVYG